VEQEPIQAEELMMEDAIQIDNRGDFGLWAIEMAKQIVADQGFEWNPTHTSENSTQVLNDLSPKVPNSAMESTSHSSRIASIR
jgi:hypothetical protein